MSGSKISYMRHLFQYTEFIFIQNQSRKVALLPLNSVVDCSHEQQLFTGCLDSYVPSNDISVIV